MCCHLVSFSASCLGYWRASEKKCWSGLRAPKSQTFVHVLKRNRIKLRATGLLSPNKVPCPLYRKTFPVSVGESSFSEKPYREHVSAPSLLSARLPLQVGATHNWPSSHTNASYFHCKLPLLFDLCQSRKALRVFGKKRPGSCQNPSVVGKQWHALCGFSAAPPSRRSFCSVRSRLPPPICFVSFGAGTPRRPDQHGRAACQKGEKNGGGNARNVVIAAISKNEEEEEKKKP